MKSSLQLRWSLSTKLPKESTYSSHPSSATERTVSTPGTDPFLCSEWHRYCEYEQCDMTIYMKGVNTQTFVYILKFENVDIGKSIKSDY